MAPGLIHAMKLSACGVIVVHRISPIRLGFPFDAPERVEIRFIWARQLLVVEVIRATAGVSERYGGYRQRIDVGHR